MRNAPPTDRRFYPLYAACVDLGVPYWDLAGADHTPLRISTWSSLAPLALPSLPREIAGA